MNITIKLLKDLNACESGISWFIEKRKRTLKSVIKLCLEDGHADYARWLLCRLMTKEQNVLWSIYSAELCIDFYEKKYPTDDRPRKAVQAAKDFLAGKIDRSAVRSAESAAWSARSAARSAESAAWSAAESAARSAAWSAESAAWSAEWSAESAARSAAGSAAWSAWSAANNKIMNYALKLLGEI